MRTAIALYLNGLELLEGLATALAVAQRPARRRAEDVLELRFGGAAVGTAEGTRLQLDELRRCRLPWCRRREARATELLPAFRRDPVGRPGVVEDDLDLRLGSQFLDLGGHLLAHHLERRAAKEGRSELHVHRPVVHPHVADDAEIHDRDDRDLGILDLPERVPDLLFGYHAAPGTERRTSVISSQSADHSSA